MRRDERNEGVADLARSHAQRRLMRTLRRRERLADAELTQRSLDPPAQANTVRRA